MTTKLSLIQMRRWTMRKKVFNAPGHKILIQPDLVEGAEQLKGSEDTLELKSASGIVISTGEQAETDIKTNQNKVDMGVIVSIGPDAWKAFGKDFTGKPWAVEGDKVIYARFGGIIVENPVDGQDYILINDEDVNIVIETDVEEESA